MIHVTVVARYPTIRAGLAAAIRSEDGFQVDSELAYIGELDSRAEDRLADALLIDLVDDSPEAIQLLREMATARALPGLVLLTTSATDALELLDLPGASLLLRDATSEEIQAAVRSAVAGLRALDSRILDAVTEQLPSLSSLDSLDGPGPLSPRELDVLDGVARGLPNKSIARELGISEHTVKFHVGSIFQKLEVSSRSEAIVTAARLGLLDLRL